jgi:AcrR family transcriptional regulator
MRERARRKDELTRRITEAAIRLHTSVGPSATSMAAVAEEAGVTRVTLYRHFPTMEALFTACMSHWRAAHDPPEPDRWRGIPSFVERVRRAVGDVYAWYESNGDELYPLYRDAAFTPPSTIAARRANTERMVVAILGDAARHDDVGRRLRAITGHVIGFWTWRSLRIDEGLTAADARTAATQMILRAGSAGA